VQETCSTAKTPIVLGALDESGKALLKLSEQEEQRAASLRAQAKEAESRATAHKRALIEEAEADSIDRKIQTLSERSCEKRRRVAEELRTPALSVQNQETGVVAHPPAFDVESFQKQLQDSVQQQLNETLVRFFSQSTRPIAFESVSPEPILVAPATPTPSTSGIESMTVSPCPQQDKRAQALLDVLKKKKTLSPASQRRSRSSSQSSTSIRDRLKELVKTPKGITPNKASDKQVKSRIHRPLGSDSESDREQRLLESPYKPAKPSVYDQQLANQAKNLEIKKNKEKERLEKELFKADHSC